KSMWKIFSSLLLNIFDWYRIARREGRRTRTSILLHVQECRDVCKRKYNSHHNQPGFKPVKQWNSLLIMIGLTHRQFKHSFCGFPSEHCSKEYHEEQHTCNEHDDASAKSQQCCRHPIGPEVLTCTVEISHSEVCPSWLSDQSTPH